MEESLVVTTFIKFQACQREGLRLVHELVGCDMNQSDSDPREYSQSGALHAKNTRTIGGVELVSREGITELTEMKVVT